MPCHRAASTVAMLSWEFISTGTVNEWTLGLGGRQIAK